MDIDKIIQERYKIVKQTDFKAINKTTLKREHFKRGYIFALENIENIFSSLNDDERLKIIDNYCKYCGSKSLPCFCNNDL